MRKVIMVFLLAAMLLNLGICVSAEESPTILTASKTEFYPFETLQLHCTFPFNETIQSEKGVAFQCKRLRCIIDEEAAKLVTPSNSRGKSHDFIWDIDTFSVGTHTVTVWPCATTLATYSPNFATFSFTVLDGSYEVQTLMTQDFEGDTFTYDETTCSVSDSSGVIKSTFSARNNNPSDNDYLDSYIKISDTDLADNPGKALYNYNLNASAFNSANYKNKNFGIIEYNTGDIANADFLACSLKYCVPSEYAASYVQFMPFVLVDELGNELSVGKVGSQTSNYYYMGGADFSTSTGTNGTVFTPDNDVWHTLSFQYDCQRGLVSFSLDGVSKTAGISIGTLPGETISAVKTVTSYRQNAVSGVALDDISIKAYTTEAAAPAAFEVQNAAFSENGANLDLNISFVNTKSSAEPYVGIIALYKDGTLERLFKSEDSVDPSADIIAKTVTMEDVGTDYTQAKGFIFEDMNTIHPLCGVVIK